MYYGIMKNVLILHGAGETPESFWIPYIVKVLREREYDVSIPQFPNTDHPDLKTWLPKALEYKNFNSETVLLGHSCGCPLILSILEKINTPINKAVLISGFSSPLPDGPSAILQPLYNWELIKNHTKQFIFINSVNDPWGCNDKQGRDMFNRLGGMLIINNEGHMGSDTFKQPYKEFPLLANLLIL